MLGTFQAFFIWLFIRSNMDKSIENLYLHTYSSESNKQISQTRNEDTQVYRKDKSWKSSARRIEQGKR